MGYRGHDLDLRTPQTWRASSSEAAGGGRSYNGPNPTQGYSNEQEIPIWVDDTVLACCNHAFDVALAHRSGEVRVEHLLHALTRIDDAADILEANGIRAASLRRETATVIASEIPVTLTNGSTTPRRADSFEEVLRLAAAHSYQRNQPVGVDDLLHVFLELRPAIRGLEFIERHLVGRRHERVERPMPAFRAAPPAYVPPPSYAPPPTYSQPPPMEPHPYEIRERFRRPTGRFFVNDPAFARPSLPNAAADTVQAATDNLQNSRLDVLEQMVRTISSQIAGQRDDADRFSGGLFDRLQSLETLVSSRPDGGGGSSIEQLLGRLDDLDERLRGGSHSDVSLVPVMERLAAIEKRLGDGLNAGMVEIDFSKVEQRLGAIESQLATRINETVSGLSQKFAEMERKVDFGDISGRLELIEEALLGRDKEVSGDIDGRMRDLAETVSLQHTTLEDTRAALTSDVREVSATLNDHGSRIASTAESLGELVRAVESLRDEERNTVSQVANLLNGYRGEVQGFVAKTNESHAVHNKELKEVHDALMKLNANQHTLAGSIDQWRTDGSGDLAVIAARMESLEREAGRPMALLTTLSDNMENMHRLTVERYHRRNRLWYWLFGTDDWVAASWPSQASRIEAERAALRQATRG